MATLAISDPENTKSQSGNRRSAAGRKTVIGRGSCRKLDEAGGQYNLNRKQTRHRGRLCGGDMAFLQSAGKAVMVFGRGIRMQKTVKYRAGGQQKRQQKE